MHKSLYSRPNDVFLMLLRDVRMREEAHRIQTEVRELLADLSRLGERTAKLKGHFGQAVDDLESIGVSMAKLSRRGERIEAMEFDDPQLRLPGVD